jgi:hypothetical protein
VGKYAKLHKEKTFQEPFFFTNGFTRRRTYKEKFIRKSHVGTPYSIRSLPFLKEKEKDPTTTLSLH